MTTDGYVAIVEMDQCDTLKSLRPKRYLGYRLLDNGEVEHLVEDNRGNSVKVKAGCGNCVFCRLLKATYLVGPPVMKEDRMKFVVLYNWAARRIIESNRRRIRGFKVVRKEAVILTERQRELLERGVREGLSVSRLARSEGVSKPAVSKALRKALSKALLVLA